MNCTCCSKDLSISIRSADGTLKSCPRCSQTHGKMHVFRKYPEQFDTTTARITANNPDGAQSHCISCRGEKAQAPSHVNFSLERMCNTVVISD